MLNVNPTFSSPCSVSLSAKNDFLKRSQILDLSLQNDAENLILAETVPATLALGVHRFLAEVSHCSAVKLWHCLDNVPSQG